MLTINSRTNGFDDIIIRLCNVVNKRNTWTKGYVLSFLKKGDLGITKNNIGITYCNRY